MKRKKLKKPLKQPSIIPFENRYRKVLVTQVINRIRASINHFIIPNLNRYRTEFNKHIKLDEFNDDVDDDFDDAEDYIEEKTNYNKFLIPIFIAINKFNRNNFNKQTKHVLGVEYPPNLRHEKLMMKTWINTNIDLIKSVQGQALQQVKSIVRNGFMKDLSNKEIQDQIKDRVDVAESRANLIGRDQVSKLNGQLNQHRQTEIGVEQYIWRTADDERVREEHAEREGELFSWDDPPEDGHPGEPVNCRCNAEAYFQDLVDL